MENIHSMQNAKCKMKNRRQDLSERILNFGVAIIKSISKMTKSPIEKHMGFQLIRSTTSAGANYEEACGAESKSDFIHKMQIVLKELRESLYWLKLIERSAFLPHENVEPLIDEANELVRIIAKSIVTARKG
jgi:four helix bundle protein